VGILAGAVGEALMRFQGETEGMAGGGRGLRERWMRGGRNECLEGQWRGGRKCKSIYHGGQWWWRWMLEKHCGTAGTDVTRHMSLMLLAVNRKYTHLLYLLRGVVLTQAESLYAHI
jgi:hypothetical protein